MIVRLLSQSVTPKQFLISPCPHAGKIAVVTGGSSGIGLETVRVLALAGAKVFVGSPHAAKAEAAISVLRLVF